MAEALRLPHSDPAHPLSEAADYLWNELSPEEKAAFEKHLPTCDSCSKAVSLGRRALPVVEEILHEDLAHRGVDPLAKLEAARRKLEGEGRLPRSLPWWRRRWQLTLAGLAALGAATAGLVVFLQPAGELLEPTFVASVATPLIVERAPVDPLHPLPPPVKPEALDVRAVVRHRGLSLDVQRGREDRYVAVSLIDGQRRLWRVRSGERPDASCGNGCAPLHLDVGLSKLPAGEVEVLVLVSGKPIENMSFDEGVEEDPAHPLPSLGERAVGQARVTK